MGKRLRDEIVTRAGHEGIGTFVLHLMKKDVDRGSYIILAIPPFANIPPKCAIPGNTFIFDLSGWVKYNI